MLMTLLFMSPVSLPSLPFPSAAAATTMSSSTRRRRRSSSSRARRQCRQVLCAFWACCRCRCCMPHAHIRLGTHTHTHICSRIHCRPIYLSSLPFLHFPPLTFPYPALFCPLPSAVVSSRISHISMAVAAFFYCYRFIAIR